MIRATIMDEFGNRREVCLEIGDVIQAQAFTDPVIWTAVLIGIKGERMQVRMPSGVVRGCQRTIRRAWRNGAEL